MGSGVERKRASASWQRAALTLALVLTMNARTAAQDSHYWSIQYGPVGQLVGGQLIGAARDLSATFYNPGALSLRNESSYLLSTESAQWEAVSSVADPGVEVLDMSSSHVGAAPSLLTGSLPRWLGRDTRLAWSFLTRQKLNLRLGRRLTNPLPGDGTTSAAESYFDQRVEEDWAGLTFSRPLSTSAGIGVTWYGIYRGQRTRKELTIQGLTGDGASQAVSGVGDFEYTHYSTLLKLGFAWQTADWNLGVSLTTPRLGVLGRGKGAYTVSVAGVDANGDGIPDAPRLEQQTQEDLDADWRSPWAVGAGVSRRAGRTRLYASVEWYGAVAAHDVLELAGSTPGGGRLGEQLRSVINGGVGFERVVNGDVSLYGAFHTDFSALAGGVRANVAIADWDIYHVSGGLSFRVRSNHFTLGASWAQGHKTRALDTPIPPEQLPDSGLDKPVAIHYSKLTVLLGFVFGS
jgi:hypothetical protein